MKRIYITGNIGSGKSFATEIFKKRGYSIISADKIAEEVLIEYKKEISKLMHISNKDIKEFKHDIGKKIFSDSEKKKELESFMICKIQVKIEHLATKYEINYLNFVIEAPTYFEVRNMLKNKNDIVILIKAPEEIRIERIKKRNPNLSKKEIYKRIISQVDENKKEKLSDFIVSNIEKNVFEKDINKIIDRLQEGGGGSTIYRTSF